MPKKQVRRPKAYRLPSGTVMNPLLKYPRNFACWCGSEKKSKYCCLPGVPEIIKGEFADEMKIFMNQKIALELSKRLTKGAKNANS